MKAVLACKSAHIPCIYITIIVSRKKQKVTKTFIFIWLPYSGKTRQRIEFDEFMINDACAKLNSININIFTSAKFLRSS